MESYPHAAAPPDTPHSLCKEKWQNRASCLRFGEINVRKYKENSLLLTFVLPYNRSKTEKADFLLAKASALSGTLAFFLPTVHFCGVAAKGPNDYVTA